MQIPIWAFLAEWSLMVVSLGAQTGYNIVTFSVPGSPATAASAINNSGVIVGLFQTGDQTDPIYGFRRSPSGAIDLVLPPGSSGSNANDINNNGVIAGLSDSDVNNSVLTNGFLSVGGKYKAVDVRGSATQLYGLNNQGAYVGIYQVPNGNYAGFAFSARKEFRIVYFPGSTYTYPVGINDSNQIVGSYGDIYDLSHGFLLDQTGTYTSIDFPGAYQTFVSKANAAGVIVGSYSPGGLAPERSFLYRDGVFQDFVVPGASGTYLSKISDAGVLCGSYLDALGNEFGFLATPVQ